MSATVLTEDVAGGVRVVTLNRPHRLNAITPELLDDLIAALRAADADISIRCIVLTGAGRAFCAGDDLREFESQAQGEAATRAYIERIQEVTRAMLLGTTPVVGALRGWAAGGGLEWVINCDLAIAATGTRFFFPEVALGVFVTGGVTYLLPRLVGLARAREMILLGEKFDADQAHAWGLLHKVVPDESLMQEALALARRVASLPPGPVRALRRILAHQADTLNAAMEAETTATVAGFLEPESARRAASFGKS